MAWTEDKAQKSLERNLKLLSIVRHYIAMHDNESDHEAKQRMEQQKCKICYYIRDQAFGKICYEATSEYVCSNCYEIKKHRNGCTPLICPACTTALKVCLDCGARIE